jgi:gluconolactonase
MQKTALKGVLSTAFALLISAFIASCANSSGSKERVVSTGSAWKEMSRVGLFSSEGVVADQKGMIYAVDLTVTEAVKVNNPGGTIYRFNPSTGTTEKFIEPSGMAFGLHIDRSGDLIIAQGAEPAGGRAIVRRNLATGTTTVLADSFEGKRLVAPNDVTSDSHGRIYFTDARYFGGETIELPNAVYRIDTDGKVTRISTDILRPNGIEVSPDGKRLYVAACNVAVLPRNPIGPAADKFGLTTGAVVAYDLDSGGNISNGRVFYRHADLPCVDGMTMDTDGNLYVAAHNGRQMPARGEIIVVNPAGDIVESIAPPEGIRASNLGFGRGADAGSLYMTTLFQWKLYRIETTRRGHYF